MGHTKLDTVALQAATLALLHKERNSAPDVDWEATRTGKYSQWKERVYYAITAYLDAAPEIAAMEQRIAELEKDAVPEGWKLVPVEPTEAMRTAGNDRLDRLKDAPGRTTADRAFYVYHAMLDAAPKQSANGA